jgi:hypothetical protein
MYHAFPMNAVLVHTGYSLMLCALAARDILWLRGTLVLAQSVLATYAWRIGNPSVAGWNLLFVAINIVWVIKILRERRAVTLPEDLRSLHERHFFALEPPEFLRWWTQGRRETLRDAKLTTHGAFPEALYFVLAGTARVSRNGAHVTTLSTGHFVGEMSLITGRPATADVVAMGDVDLIRWPIEDLKALREHDPAMWARIQSAIGQDLVVKVQRSMPQT